jgi:hypothetical protein
MVVVVATPALGSRSKQRGNKVAGEEEAWESRQEEAWASNKRKPGSQGKRKPRSQGKEVARVWAKKKPENVRKCEGV